MIKKHFFSREENISLSLNFLLCNCEHKTRENLTCIGTNVILTQYVYFVFWGQKNSKKKIENDVKKKGSHRKPILY